VRGLAVVRSSANAEGRKDCRAARRSSTSRRGPLPAGCQALAGRPGVLHGRQRRSKMNTPAQHPSAPTPRFQPPPYVCPFSFWPLGPQTASEAIKLPADGDASGRIYELLGYFFSLGVSCVQSAHT